ncbi:MAG: PrsW family intramembrane metalloprotease [Candidatus Thermoplasmatota archaeon]
MNQELLITVSILVGSAFIPSLIYLIWIRNAEIYVKKSWSKLARTFFWGAGLSVSFGFILSLIFVGVISTPELQREYEFLADETIQSLIIVVIIAPFVEEFTKVLGVLSVRDSLIDVEAGLIFGAACGLGFAATENLLYESSVYLSEGFGSAFISMVILRSIASTLLHGSASAMAGYGITSAKFKGWYLFLPYYLLAVVMHGAFNLLASLELVVAGDISLFAVVLVVLFSLLSITYVRKKIKKLDRE